MAAFENHAVLNGEDVTIEQRAEPKSFLGLSLKNGLLNLVTLTLYRFWGKTEVRRRLWSSIHINDEPLEYTGRGVELFVGFLLAMAVIGLPFLILVFGAQFMGPVIAGPALLVLYAAMIYLIGFGRFTAFRYLASRTVWRGVRFQMEGSANSYAWAFIGYLLLSAVTLGWFWPAAQRRLSGRLWASLRFGDKAFVYNIDRARKTAPVYWPYVISGAMSFAAYVVFAVLMYVLVPGISSGEAAQPRAADIARIYLASFIVLPLFAIAVAPYQAAALRTVVAGIGLEQVEAKLKLSWLNMAWLYISNIVLATMSLGFLMPFIQARTSKFLLGRMELSGQANLTDVRQAPQGPKSGEGLADAFGLAPI